LLIVCPEESCVKSDRILCDTVVVAAVMAAVMIAVMATDMTANMTAKGLAESK
jgi:hypothetical protein